ncbi:MAG TPA: dihydrofolate reductase family protein [Galbitalea sp.]|jgi:dihydrofolate reductase
MAKLIYTAICSLDGYTADADGGFDWAAPDEQVHAFVNDLERPIGTYLYGRRLYETMRVWQDLGDHENPVVRDFALMWQSAQKIVYSAALDGVSTTDTTLERSFEPTAVAALKGSSGSDLSIGGATLAGIALAAGLVDEVRLFLAAAIVGGGTRALPDAVRRKLTLLDERRFDSGVVYLRYAVA